MPGCAARLCEAAACNRGIGTNDGLDANKSERMALRGITLRYRRALRAPPGPSSPLQGAPGPSSIAPSRAPTGERNTFLDPPWYPPRGAWQRIDFSVQTENPTSQCKTHAAGEKFENLVQCTLEWLAALKRASMGKARSASWSCRIDRVVKAPSAAAATSTTTGSTDRAIISPGRWRFTASYLFGASQWQPVLRGHSAHTGLRVHRGPRPPRLTATRQWPVGPAAARARLGRTGSIRSLLHNFLSGFMLEMHVAAVFFAPRYTPEKKAKLSFLVSARTPIVARLALPRVHRRRADDAWVGPWRPSVAVSLIQSPFPGELSDNLMRAARGGGGPREEGLGGERKGGVTVAAPSYLITPAGGCGVRAWRRGLGVVALNSDIFLGSPQRPPRRRLSLRVSSRFSKPPNNEHAVFLARGLPQEKRTRGTVGPQAGQPLQRPFRVRRHCCVVVSFRLAGQH